jgi:hypothetical protein
MIISINVSGADGLIKLWTVEPEKCVATYYDHLKDKVPVEVDHFVIFLKTDSFLYLFLVFVSLIFFMLGNIVSTI